MSNTVIESGNLSSAIARVTRFAVGGEHTTPDLALALPTQLMVPADVLTYAYPQLRNARQPSQSAGRGAPVLRPWKSDLKRFSLRQIASSPAGLVGPFKGAGDCLDPFLRSGDLTWIDPPIEPESGDFVMVQWTEAIYQRIRVKLGAEFKATTGREPSGIACKRLQRIDGEWLLTTAGSRGATAAVPLGFARILGVVTFVTRNGKPLRTREVRHR